MKLHLVAVGMKMPDWVTAGFEEYAKRMPTECRLYLQEIQAAKRGKSGHVGHWIAEEGERIMATVPANHRVIALDIKGQSWSTVQLAQHMEKWMHDGRDVSLLIGGPDGMAETCLQRADQTWSLSALTLPHPLVRIIVAEQLYRAWSVICRHPYHRA